MNNIKIMQLFYYHESLKGQISSHLGSLTSAVVVLLRQLEGLIVLLCLIGFSSDNCNIVFFV